MQKLQSDLITNKYTEVWREEGFTFNAPHNFEVRQVEAVTQPEPNPKLVMIHFQEGPIKECGINGCCNEDLIAMCICRLEYFQNSEYKCRENAVAITKLEEALMWLRKRTNAREIRGVEGTHTV